MSVLDEVLACLEVLAHLHQEYQKPSPEAPSPKETLQTEQEYEEDIQGKKQAENHDHLINKIHFQEKHNLILC